MFRVIICDDNKCFVETMMELLMQYKELYDLEIEGFCEGREVLEYCKNNTFDIIYMDIEMGVGNGMDLAKALKMINPRALIIYVSAYERYYRDLVNAEPFYFISKGGTERFKKEVANILDKAVERIKGMERWTYRFGFDLYSVELGKIEYMYSFARKIYILSTEKLEQDYYYDKIEHVQQGLAEINDRFVRINKRTIANISFVMWDGKNKIKIDGKIFSLAPEYRESFEKTYAKYWGDFF